MNKKNFRRVLARIERFPTLFDQAEPPRIYTESECGTPYCFLGHAQALMTSDAIREGEYARPAILPSYDMKLAKWLGVREPTLERLYSGVNTLAYFKRCLAAGRVLRLDHERDGVI